MGAKKRQIMPHHEIFIYMDTHTVSTAIFQVNHG